MAWMTPERAQTPEDKIKEAEDKLTEGARLLVEAALELDARSRMHRRLPIDPDQETPAQVCKNTASEITQVLKYHRHHYTLAKTPLPSRNRKAP